MKNLFINETISEKEIIAVQKQQQEKIIEVIDTENLCNYKYVSVWTPYLYEASKCLLGIKLYNCQEIDKQIKELTKEIIYSASIGNAEEIISLEQAVIQQLKKIKNFTSINDNILVKFYRNWMMMSSSNSCPEAQAIRQEFFKKLYGSKQKEINLEKTLVKTWSYKDKTYSLVNTTAWIAFKTHPLKSIDQIELDRLKKFLPSLEDEEVEFIFEKNKFNFVLNNSNDAIMAKNDFEIDNKEEIYNVIADEINKRDSVLSNILSDLKCQKDKKNFRENSEDNGKISYAKGYSIEKIHFIGREIKALLNKNTFKGYDYSDEFLLEEDPLLIENKRIIKELAKNDNIDKNISLEGLIEYLVREYADMKCVKVFMYAYNYAKQDSTLMEYLQSGYTSKERNIIRVHLEKLKDNFKNWQENQDLKLF